MRTSFEKEFTVRGLDAPLKIRFTQITAAAGFELYAEVMKYVSPLLDVIKVGSAATFSEAITNTSLGDVVREFWKTATPADIRRLMEAMSKHCHMHVAAADKWVDLQLSAFGNDFPALVLWFGWTLESQFGDFFAWCTNALFGRLQGLLAALVPSHPISTG